MTAPMREELTRAGFRELTTGDEVDQAVASAEVVMTPATLNLV
ncbi:MAG: BrxA/BrxB family bacilliredoxin, partial [Acidobacteriota bacterium]